MNPVRAYLCHPKGWPKNKAANPEWFRDMIVMEAKTLNYGDHVLFVDNSNCIRSAKVNGKPKTWKRSSGCVLSLKYGLYEYFPGGSRDYTSLDAISRCPRIVVPVKHKFLSDTPAEVVLDWVLENELQ